MGNQHTFIHTLYGTRRSIDWPPPEGAPSGWPAAVYATDGTQTVARDDKGFPVRTARGNTARDVAWAAVRHDGRDKALGGRLDALSNNYTAELAAIVALLQHEPRGSRIIVVMDATSPVQSLLSYSKRHMRRGIATYELQMVDAAWQAARRHEVVVFLWQTSHIGAPLNESADRAADAARA